MMDTPDGLVGKSREERSVHGFTDLDNGPTDVFPKPLLVAEFVTEGCTSYEDNVLAENSDFEDLACGGEINRLAGLDSWTKSHHTSPTASAERPRYCLDRRR